VRANKKRKANEAGIEDIGNNNVKLLKDNKGVRGRRK
jgi:hypothetical protein